MPALAIVIAAAYSKSSDDQLQCLKPAGRAAPPVLPVLHFRLLAPSYAEPDAPGARTHLHRHDGLQTNIPISIAPAQRCQANCQTILTHPLRYTSVLTYFNPESTISVTTCASVPSC